MKIIFLDMDGVMNSAEWMKTLKEGEAANRVYSGDGDQWWLDMIDPATVEQLNRIVHATGARVVISSTWRLRHEPGDMQRLLAAKGFTGEVIDRTPRRSSEQRGHEIAAWLEDHPEVREFVILDDDSDMAHLEARLVKTYWQHWEHYPQGELGLGPEAADRAISLLIAGKSTS